MVLTKLAEGTATDGDISSVKDELVRIAGNQLEKADVFSSVMNQIDHERLVDWTFIRAQSEKEIKRAASRGDMSTIEAVTVYNLANEAINQIQQRQPKTKPVDTVAVVEKVDVKRQHTDRTLEARWAGTTPQGREIIRKKLYDLKKEILAELNARAVIDVASEPVPAT